MKTLWKILAWLSIACGLIAYFIAWIALARNATMWNVSTEFWFYNAIGAGIFGIFFLIYGGYDERGKL